jgi:hypothetical protein
MGLTSVGAAVGLKVGSAVGAPVGDCSCMIHHSKRESGARALKGGADAYRRGHGRGRRGRLEGGRRRGVLSEGRAQGE